MGCLLGVEGVCALTGRALARRRIGALAYSRRGALAYSRNDARSRRHMGTEAGGVTRRVRQSRGRAAFAPPAVAAVQSRDSGAGCGGISDPAFCAVVHSLSVCRDYSGGCRLLKPLFIAKNIRFIPHGGFSLCAIVQSRENGHECYWMRFLTGRRLLRSLCSYSFPRARGMCLPMMSFLSYVPSIPASAGEAYDGVLSLRQSDVHSRVGGRGASRGDSIKIMARSIPRGWKAWRVCIGSRRYMSNPWGEIGLSLRMSRTLYAGAL